MGFTFRELKIEDAQQALDWRNKKRVTKFMNTDLSYDLESQKNWIMNQFNCHNSYIINLIYIRNISKIF